MINKNFTLILLGKLISQLGDKFYALALAWWILQKTNSPGIMGLFLLAATLPEIMIGFFAGAFVDCWKRKTTIIITDLLRGGLVLLISYLTIANLLEVWHVFIIAACLSIITAFFNPAIQAIIPEIVGKEDLTKANGLSQMVSGICTVTGPLFGALAVSILGAAWVFLGNSVSYFISALLTSFIIIKKDYRNFAEKKFIWNDVLAALNFIKSQEKIILVLKIIALAHLFVGSLAVSLPFLARGLEGSGVRNLGYLEMMMGAGLITGSIFMSLKKILAKERHLLAFMMILGISYLAISISQFLRVGTIYPYLVEMVVVGCAIAFASIFWQSLLQKYTPTDMAGRVFGISSLVGDISLPAAYLISGFLLNLIPIWQLMLGSGAFLIVLCYYWFFNQEKIRTKLSV